MRLHTSTLIVGFLVVGVAFGAEQEKKTKQTTPKRQTKQQTGSAPKSQIVPPPGFGPTTGKGASATEEAPSATPFVIPPGFGPKTQEPAPPARPAPAAAAAPKAGNPAPAPQAAPNGQPKASTAAPLEIPAGAKQIAPQTYSHTDAQGRRWTYRETPFGVRRFPYEANQPENRSASSAAERTRVTEEGDTLRFERDTPFGSRVWTKKKTDLDEDETAAWKAFRDRKGSRQ